MGNNSCPRIICGFLLIIGLLFTPNCLAARNLANLRQKNYQTQSCVCGSHSGHAGSSCTCPPPGSRQNYQENSPSS
ncbi:hypothetical protein OWV82_016774 [Melia azedarach]|uniref:Uncharacterized protein n=1 Tax=Melia azedarach TaxID=155640 RepID=A0ACC1XJS2_MELAZ|nr:hypothetical protein OWV82_016774 [Melia azedarach]